MSFSCRLFSLFAWLTVGLSVCWSQPVVPAPPSEEKGTYLGVLLAPVPDLLYDQLPQLARGHGVVIAHVLPESPASRASLRRNDLLLGYDEEKIRDCEHLARLIRDDRAGRKVRLTLLRSGKETTAEATLALGPVLRVAEASRARTESDAVPRGIAKPANPAAVTIAATPLGNNGIKVTIEYYQDGTGPLRTVTCSGTPEEIDEQIQKLPARVQEMARVGVRRLRDLAIPKPDPSPLPGSPGR
jgi:hypothetical protein